MSVFIFCGPTLAAEEVRNEIDAVCLPPVAQGDLYRVARLRPRAIGIVDGYFDRIPAVWHKEILWAMAQGIHVYGSASMGALRAAELAAFGMVGVGWVFEQFRDGVLEDDDEVAIAHAANTGSFAVLSEAMVNMRQTLAAATTEGILSEETCAALIAIAKAIFYPERSYSLLLRRGQEQCLAPGELDALRVWLPHGQVNQKRDDAIAMVRQMRGDLAEPPQPLQVGYHFEHTTWWDRAVRFGSIDAAHEASDREPLQLKDLLDELRLNGRAYSRAHDHAALRLLSLREAQRRGLETTSALVEETAAAWRRQRGLVDAAEFADWLKHNRLSPAEFERLMAEEALVLRARGVLSAEVTHRLIDDLLVAGAYGNLLARARDKVRVLEERGLLNPGLNDAGIERAELIRWHFAQRGEAVPANLALHATNAGFGDEEGFVIALLREWCYFCALHEARPL